MEHETPKVVIQYLTILELSLDKTITKEMVKQQYRKLVHVYHPDASVDIYHDGERFQLLQKAYEYLSNDIDYVNTLVRNDFRSPSSSNDSAFREQPKEQTHTYYSQPVYKYKKGDDLFEQNWFKTKKFFFITSIIGAILAIFIFAFGFINYVSVENYVGSYPTGRMVWHTYNLYESTAESYGVYHCAVAFHFVVISLLMLGLIVAFIQKNNDSSSIMNGIIRFVLNFLTFGLAIPLAVFHMITARGGMYETGQGGEIVLTVFTWFIIVLFFIRTVVSMVPLIRTLKSKIF